MKNYFVGILNLLTLILSLTGLSQDKVHIHIDTTFCSNFQKIEGEFGIYQSALLDQRNAREGMVDTLFQTLEFVTDQKVIVPKNSDDFKVKFIPSDTLVQESEMPLYSASLGSNTLNLDCYFFREPIPLLDQLEDGDTLLITKEYCGNSHTGMKFDRSCIRIVKRKDAFYFSRNDLPVRGDLVIITFPVGGYEAGFSEEQEVSSEQLNVLHSFERSIPHGTAYSLEFGSSLMTISLKNNTFKFIINWHIQNEHMHTIWEILK